MSDQADTRRAGNRAAMPTVSAWIDDLREAFGADVINQALVRGTRGERDQFHAVEGDLELGTPFRPGQTVRILEQ